MHTTIHIQTYLLYTYMAYTTFVIAICTYLPEHIASYIIFLQLQTMSCMFQSINSLGGSQLTIASTASK